MAHDNSKKEGKFKGHLGKKGRSRIMKERKEIEKNPVDGVQISPVGDLLDEWRGLVSGPIDSPYEDGVFVIEIKYPPSYPTKPPNVVMKTPIYHMNINSKGVICLGKLSSDWNKKYTLRDILQDLVDLLKNPSVQDGLAEEIHALFVYNEAKYIENATKCTQLHAKPKTSTDNGGIMDDFSDILSQFNNDIDDKNNSNNDEAESNTNANNKNKNENENENSNNNNGDEKDDSKGQANDENDNNNNNNSENMIDNDKEKGQNNSEKMKEKTNNDGSDTKETGCSNDDGN